MSAAERPNLPLKDMPGRLEGEKIWDRCVYPLCQNGRFYNRRKLFNFPKTDPKRLEAWITNCGNERLRTLSTITVRRHGVCGDHFTNDSFTSVYRQKLKPDAIPLRYDLSPEVVTILSKARGKNDNSVEKTDTPITRVEISASRPTENSNAVSPGSSLVDTNSSSIGPPKYVPIPTKQALDMNSDEKSLALIRKKEFKNLSDTRILDKYVIPITSTDLQTLKIISPESVTVDPAAIIVTESSPYSSNNAASETIAKKSSTRIVETIVDTDISNSVRDPPCSPNELLKRQRPVTPNLVKTIKISPSRLVMPKKHKAEPSNTAESWDEAKIHLADSIITKTRIVERTEIAPGTPSDRIVPAIGPGRSAASDSVEPDSNSTPNQRDERRGSTTSTVKSSMPWRTWNSMRHTTPVPIESLAPKATYKLVEMEKVRTENENLRKKIRFLQTELKKMRRQLVQRLKLKHVREIRNPAYKQKKLHETIKQLLTELDIEPAAKALILLQLHKRHAPYSIEEKILAAEFFNHCPSAINFFHKAGINFPTDYCIKYWLARNEIPLFDDESIPDDIASNKAETGQTVEEYNEPVGLEFVQGGEVVEIDGLVTFFE